MREEAQELLDSPKWKERATQIDRKVEVGLIEDPYDDGSAGLLELGFHNPNPPKPLYAWERPEFRKQAVNISVFRDGCGILLVHGLWGFGDDSGVNTERLKEYVFLIEFLMDLGAKLAREGEWGEMFVASTSTEQPHANKYLAKTGWEKVATTKNPRSGNTMYLWTKHTRVTKPRKAKTPVPAVAETVSV